MSAQRYHKTIRGYYEECHADKRRCPRSQHIPTARYQELKKSGSIEVPLEKAPSKHGFYAEAVKEYEQMSILENKKARVQRELTAHSEHVKSKYDVENVPPHDALENTLKASYASMKQAYIDAGVNGGKAHYLVQDIEKEYQKTGRLEMITKSRDKYDPDIKAKTAQAKAALEADPEHQQRLDDIAHIKHVRKQVDLWHADIGAKHEQLTRKYHAYGYYSHDEKKKLEKKVQDARALLKAGLPSTAISKPTQKLTSEDITVDKDGRINNMYVSNQDGTVSRVRSFMTAEEANHTSDVFVTEEGRKVYDQTHYHSYKKNQEGYQNVFVVPNKRSKPFDRTFSLHSTIDSGG